MNTLLLIEDDHRLAHMVSEYLEQSGFSVQHAANGLNGLKTLQDIAPDMVLLDLMLPDIDGLEVCRRIRALPGALAHTPVLMLLLIAWVLLARTLWFASPSRPSWSARRIGMFEAITGLLCLAAITVAYRG